MLRFALLVAAVAACVVVPFLLWGGAIERLLGAGDPTLFLRQWGGIAWAVAVGLLVGDLVLPVPTTGVMAALGVVYGPVLGGAIATGGAMLAALVAYLVGRLLGRPAVHALMGAEATRDGEVLFARSGGWIVALSRWVPVLSEVMACIAGLSRMPLRQFLVAASCGAVPLGFAFAGIGHVGADAPALTIVLSALLPAALWPFARRLLPPRAKPDPGTL